MNSRTKNALYSLFLLTAIVVVWLYRNQKSSDPIKLEGKTMGTSYHITYFDDQKRNFQHSVDSLLEVVNKSINTYDSTSEISRFNRADKSFIFRLPYFFPPLKKSKEVVEGSQGAYDPTVMPLVNAWGFGPKKIVRPDTAEVLAAREYVGFEKINFNNDSIWKNDSRVQIDFGAIGQGYGSDVIADFLRSKSINNFFIELGGEGVAWGKNLQENKAWKIGILDPNSDYIEQKFKAYAALENLGYTTSGNYFNYREVDGIKYSHTIDPSSGFPVQHELLSATVFASDCSTADAWATAFMSMGHLKALEILKSHPELNVFFIYSSKEGIKTYVSEGIKDHLQIQP
ncbi:MAG: FAD:protein FMN transferase [Cyclobacteriaceae bacterium]|nr:FAD:protein FMN transferase [Cyclobacteriaceae bacterium]